MTQTESNKDKMRAHPPAPERRSATATEESGFWSQWTSGDSRSGRVLAIFNPTAGDTPAARDAQTALLERLRTDLSTHGLGLEPMAFEPTHLRHAMQARLCGDLRAIFVFGGDGTVLAVVEALEGAQVPLAILPQGTMNWLARDLGLPPDPEQALAALMNPTQRQIDIGQVNGHPFLCACMVGVAALLARYREQRRQQSRWRRWPALFVKALRLWGRYPHLRLNLVAEGKSQRLRSRTLVVVNNRLEPALRLLPARPHLDEGVLALYAMRRATLKRLRLLLARLMTGAWSMEDVLLSETGKTLCVELPGITRLPVLLDGEIRRLNPPLNFNIKARAIPVLVPACPNSTNPLA